MLKYTTALLASTGLAALVTSAGVGDDTVPIDIGASYDVGYQAPPIGSDAGSSTKQRLTLNLKADTSENGTFFFQYQNHNGEHGVNNVGDIQQFDGLDDPEYDRIHMLWYQHVFADGAFRLKVGKVEPKSEFFAPENARNHLGFSTERSPTIIAQGPPSMSVNAFFKPSDNFELAVGVYDATWNKGRNENNFKLHNLFEADDLAIFVEGRFTWDEGVNGLPGGVKLGGWRLDGERTRFDGTIASGTEGFYAVYDQTLTDNGIGMYAQFGTASKNVSPLSRHIGLGMQWKGPFANRPDDTFGTGVSSVKFSTAADAPFVRDSETAWEVFYKAPINQWFTVQFDVQAINNPGGMGADDVVVSVMRGSIAF